MHIRLAAGLYWLTLLGPAAILAAVTLAYVDNRTARPCDYLLTWTAALFWGMLHAMTFEPLLQRWFRKR